MEKKTKFYLVRCDIYIEAESPKAAAMEARIIQKIPGVQTFEVRELFGVTEPRGKIEYITITE